MAQPFEQLNFDGFFEQYKKPKMGISSGLASLDKIFFGFNPGCLYMVGGSSGIGKTALFIDFILAAARKVPVGFMSLEMTIPELQERMVCRIADVNSQKLKAGKLELDEKNEIQKAIKEIKKLNTIAITEEANCFYPQYILEQKKPENSIEHLIEDWVSKGCKIFFMDYLQMAELSERTDREDIKIKKQCEKLKTLAKQYKVPIVAAVQLSGAPDERHLKKEDPKPVMRDMWGSIYLRASADVIMLLYREEYYHKQGEPSLYDRSTEEALIRIPKNRAGVSDVDVPVIFRPYCTSFSDIEQDTVDDLF